MHLTHGIHRASRLTPDQPALRCADRCYTWAAFADRVARAAAHFVALGARDGDRIAMLADNSDDVVLFYFASLWAGCVMVPLNTRWSDAELAFAVDDCTPVLLLADAAHLERARGLAAGCATRLLETGHADAGLEAALTETEPMADRYRGYEDLAAIFYTGGTTGRAKGVMLSHRNFVANSMTAMVNMGIDAASVHLHVAPLFHVAGGARVFSVTLAGGTHVVLPRFDPVAFLAAVERFRVTLTVLVPTMIGRLVQEPRLQDFDLSSLKLLSYGASPMPEAVLRRLMTLLPDVRLLQSYGMTELSPVATVLPPEYHVFEGPLAGRIRAAGLPAYNVDVAVVDSEDRPLATGEIGEVVVRGPNVMQGYWGLPELTAQTLRGGWMHTGDAGYLDDAGFLFLVDRVKDMIVSGGENVYSVEVEQALHQHPAVHECAVIGVPDDAWGERVHAVVVPEPGAAVTEAELTAHCRSFIAPYKCPRSYSFPETELPKSGPGKILKTALRAPFWQDRERGVN
jgi:long-chain acyl-CoA synthetase